MSSISERECGCTGVSGSSGVSPYLAEARGNAVDGFVRGVVSDRGYDDGIVDDGGMRGV